MKCIECGAAMTKTVGDHVYTESGMDHVILRNVAKYDCPKCRWHSVEIERMAQLHRLLAEILVRKHGRLIPSEVRFLRDHLELTNRDFAIVMGVSETQASRWTTSDPIGLPAEHLLRMLATAGPVVLAAGAPKVELGKIKGGEFVADIAATAAALRSTDAPAKATPVRIKRTGPDWKHEQQATS